MAEVPEEVATAAASVAATEVSATAAAARVAAATATYRQPAGHGGQHDRRRRLQRRRRGVLQQYLQPHQHSWRSRPGDAQRRGPQRGSCAWSLRTGGVPSIGGEAGRGRSRRAALPRRKVPRVVLGGGRVVFWRRATYRVLARTPDPWTRDRPATQPLCQWTMWFVSNAWFVPVPAATLLVFETAKARWPSSVLVVKW